MFIVTIKYVPIFKYINVQYMNNYTTDMCKFPEINRYENDKSRFIIRSHFSSFSYGAFVRPYLAYLTGQHFGRGC